MIEFEIKWDTKALFDKLKNSIKKNNTKYSIEMKNDVKRNTPVYDGPPRSSGRAPGTLRDSIFSGITKDGDGFVLAPFPAAFIEFGVSQDSRAPNPFLHMAFSRTTRKYFEAYKNII